MVDMKNKSNFVEGYNALPSDEEKVGIRTPIMKLEADGMVYNTYTSYHDRAARKGRDYVWVKVFPEDHFNHQVREDSLMKY